MSAGDFYTVSVEEQADRLGQLARAALPHWGENWGEPSLIKHRENAVFAISDDAGRRAVLRIHRHAYHSDAELLSELQWMQALHEAGLVVPAVIVASNGASFVHVSHPLVPEPRQIDVLGWVPGAPIGAIEDMPTDDPEGLAQTYRHIGVLAGKVHDQAQAWPLPEGFTRHAWDKGGLLGPEPFWGRFWELPALSSSQIALLQRAREAAAADLDRIGTGSDIYSIIHADFVPENVFADNSNLALIDFDDAGFGWHMFELATALFFLQDHPHYPAIRSALFAGYEQQRPGKADPSLLPLFLFLRSTTYLGWVHTRPEVETAKELTPLLIEMACRQAEEYLGAKR